MYRQPADHWMNVLSKSICPLLAMLRIAPPYFVARNERVGALLECHCFGVRCPQRGHTSAFAVDGINSIETKFACLSSLLSRRHEAQRVDGTYSHIAQTAISGVAENPLPAAALGNTQIEAAAI
jgi:hypothetical protein